VWEWLIQQRYIELSKYSILFQLPNLACNDRISNTYLVE
jgi:hypothetical protein